MSIETQVRRSRMLPCVLVASLFAAVLVVQGRSSAQHEHASTPPRQPSTTPRQPSTTQRPASKTPRPVSATQNAIAPVDRRAEIRRDRFGVPHILGATEEAAAFAHGYTVAEDHGAALARLFLRARGTLASVFGETFVADDVRAQTLGIHEIASERFHELPPYMQRIANGYAAGYNLYLERHRTELPSWATPVTGVDILAHARAVLLLDFALNLSPLDHVVHEGTGSNMWAIGRPLSKSGHGMLLANPHLPWDGGTVFHEVHLTVPGTINVSGAALVGIPVVGIGFNASLGWTHTVNRIDSDDMYELTLDETRTRYRYDEGWLPLERRVVSIPVKTAAGVRIRRETVFHSHYGPVLKTHGDKAYALKSANLDGVNFLTQWNAMAKATSLREFVAAINMQQLPLFNVGYADRDGNTWYLFNGRIPIRPSGYDWSGIVPGNTSKTEWFTIRPIGELPQLLNPRTGYIQNCNDAPWYTNIEQPIDPAAFADYVSGDGLDWRSQASLRILSAERDLTLDELKAYKYDSEVVFADRVKGELIAALRERGDADSREAADVLEQWNNRVDADSRGATLFLAWWNQYLMAVRTHFRTPWSPERPLDTPTGLADMPAALAAIDRIGPAVKRAFGSLDVPWGQSHRIRRGTLDLPVGGAPMGTLLNLRYRAAQGRTFEAIGGDTYMLVVEFTADGPNAFSVLPYSQSSNPRSPHFNDQAPVYVNKQFKPAWFSEADVAAHAARVYRPDGEAARGVSP